MKKLISAALVFISLIGCLVPMSASAVGESMPSEELGLLRALDLIKEDGFGESDILTRAEFCDLICTLFRYNKNPDAELPFRDIDPSHPYYASVAALYSRGAINGLSKYTIAPNRSITLEEAGTIAVTALGYSKMAELGMSTYYSQAAELGLFDGISIGIDDGLTEEAAVKMMYNILFAPIMGYELEGDGLNYSVDSDLLMINEVYDIYETEGIIRENPITSFYGESTLADDEIRIEDEVYTSEAEGISDLLGYYVKAFVREIQNEQSAVVYAYADSRKNNEAEILSEDILSAGDSLIEYEDGTRNKRARLSQAADVVYNGIGVESFDLADLESMYGSIKLIDNNGDEYYDLMRVDDYKLMVVQNITLDEKSLLINDKSGNSFEADLEKVDCSLSVTNRDAEASVGDITAGTPILILDSGEREKTRIIEIYMPSERLAGTLTAVNEEELTVDSRTVGIASIFGVADINSYMSKNVTLFVDIFGNAIYLSSAGEGSYGFLFKMSKLDDVDETIQVKILTTDNEWVKYNLRDKLKYNGETKKADFVYDSIVDIDGVTLKQMVRYTANENDEITDFQTAQYKDSDTPGFVDEKTDEMLREKGLFRKSMGKKTRQYVNAMNGLFDGADYNKWVECFLSSPYILVRPDTNDMSEEDVQFYTSYFRTEGDYLCEGFDRTEDNYMPVVVVYEAIEPKDLDGFVLVDRVVDELDEDDQVIRVLYGWYEGTLNAYKAENENSFMFEGREVQCGDLVRMAENFNGEITGISKLRFTLSSDPESQYTDYDVQDITEDFRSLDSYAGNQMVVGVVDKVVGEYMRVRVKNGKHINVKLRSDARYIIYDDSRKTKLSAGSMSDITVGETVVARLYYGRLDDVFFYKLK